MHSHNGGGLLVVRARGLKKGRRSSLATFLPPERHRPRGRVLSVSVVVVVVLVVVLLRRVVGAFFVRYRETLRARVHLSSDASSSRFCDEIFFDVVSSQKVQVVRRLAFLFSSSYLLREHKSGKKCRRGSIFFFIISFLLQNNKKRKKERLCHTN